jgi:hypothetical protein
MSPQEMEEILQSLLARETSTLDSPSSTDWQQLESKFGCKFGEDFKTFIGLMSRYSFPGDILNVSSGKTNGNDSIELTYDLERQGSAWNPAMIPFYAIGNGDYFCINKDECPSSQVYYFYAERPAFERYSNSFGEWVAHLPQFLA